MDPTALHYEWVAYALGALKIADEIVRLIPDKWLTAHTTVQAVTNAIHGLYAWLTTPGAR